MSSGQISLSDGYFRKTAWAKFNPKACLVTLADERDAYAGLKKVLYAGTCAWMIAPQNPQLIKNALRLAALKTLSEAEEAALAGGFPRIAVADWFARSSILGPKFIEEIYYPIGGAIGLARAPAIKDFKADIGSEFPRLDYAVTLVKIYHHHATHLSGQTRYGKPSLNKAADLVEELDIRHGNHKTPTKSRYLKDAWAQNRETIALLYAASTIQTNSGKTLLEKIRLCENNFTVDEMDFRTMVARAKFVAEEILSKCAETETSEDNSWLIPRSVRPEPFPAPQFNDAHQEIIRRKFSRSAV